MSGETSPFLLSLVHEHGYNLTASQLRRLHLEGIIARPLQEHPAGKAGSETIYPLGTGTILLAFCEQRGKIRSFSSLAWQLWWDGYEIPLATIRQHLHQTITTWTRLRQTLIKPGSKTLSKATWKALRKAASYRFQEPALNQARKRVGTVSFDTFLRILLETATGQFQAYTNDYAGAREEERHIMEKGFGLKQTPLDRTLHLDWGAQLEPVLVLLGRLVVEDPWMLWLDTVNDPELLTIRGELKLVQTALFSLNTAMEEMAGKRPSGGSILYSLLGKVSHQSQPFLLLCWGILRQRLATNTQEILQVAHQWQEEFLPAYTALCQLQQEIPSSKELFAQKRIYTFLRSDQQREQHLAECRNFYQTRQEELVAFWQRHPEWSQRWGQQVEDSAC